MAQPVLAPMLEEPGCERGPGQMDQIVRVAKALGDPIRVRMVQSLAVGRGMLGLPSLRAMSVPGPDNIDGVCVCEFQEVFSLGQSKVSYHLRVLREANLVVEEARGKWSFYCLNRHALREMSAAMALEFKL